MRRRRPLTELSLSASLAIRCFGCSFLLVAACQKEAEPAPAAEPVATPVASAPSADKPPVEASSETEEASEPPPVEPQPVAKGDPSSKAPPSAARSAPGKVTRGPAATDAAFTAYLQSSGAYAAGQQGAVSVVLESAPPYKCNDKYPYKFKPDTGTAGVTYPTKVVKGMQVGKKRSTMSVPFVAAKSGDAKVSGTLHFSVCTDDKCLVEKRPLTINVHVN